MPTNRAPDPYDVAVIGGGPAGSAAASWPARQSARPRCALLRIASRIHTKRPILPTVERGSRQA